MLTTMVEACVYDLKIKIILHASCGGLHVVSTIVIEVVSVIFKVAFKVVRITHVSRKFVIKPYSSCRYEILTEGRAIETVMKHHCM